MLVPPTTASKKRLYPQDDSLLAGSNRHINPLPELLRDFDQPSVGDFALSDASRFNINFCEGASEAVREFSRHLISVLFFNHRERYGLTFYRHLDAFGKG